MPPTKGFSGEEGVDGAIHRAAGAGNCSQNAERWGGCDTGDAKITRGYNLKARHVIHTVGPIYSQRACPASPDCWQAVTLGVSRLPIDHNLVTMAFPSISTGAYGYPIKDACKIALTTTMDQLNRFSRDDTNRLYPFFLRPTLRSMKRLSWL